MVGAFQDKNGTAPLVKLNQSGKVHQDCMINPEARIPIGTYFL
jgi:hypothetical protein